MLTDIFTYRYADVPMWTAFAENHRRLIVQGYRIIEEHLYPPYIDGKESKQSQEKWKVLHDRLSNELGHHELSKRAYSYQTTWNGKPHTQSGLWTWNHVCKEFVCKEYDADWDADNFIKNRLSFFELAFREKGEEIHVANAELPEKIRADKLRRSRPAGRGIRIPGPSSPDAPTWAETANGMLNENFQQAIHEFNTRLRQARLNLNYHNGFIQISADETVEEQIAEPFWTIVAESRWQNVDTDMKEAIDRRDSGGRDPSFYAAKALESTIKILAKEKGWTHGGEKGAHSYIDNLSSKKNGQFIDQWEAELLKNFFTDVRNPFSHGSGDEKMPKLSDQQTNWAIEFAMSWVRSLVERS